MVCGVALLAALVGVFYSTIHESNLREKARLEALQKEQDAETQREMEREKIYAAIDAETAKIDAKIWWQPVPGVHRSQRDGSGGPAVRPSAVHGPSLRFIVQKADWW